MRGPRHSVRKRKTPVLTAEEARAMLDTIDITTPVGLRDRALIGLMVYTFARVGAAIGMRVEDVYVQGRRTWVRLHEKGGNGLLSGRFCSSSGSVSATGLTVTPELLNDARMALRKR